MPPQLSLNLEAEPAIYQGTSGEGQFCTVSPSEDSSTVTELERQKRTEEGLTNSFYRMMCEQDRILEHAPRASDFGVTC